MNTAVQLAAIAATWTGVSGMLVHDERAHQRLLRGVAIMRGTHR